MVIKRGNAKDEDAFRMRDEAKLKGSALREAVKELSTERRAEQRLAEATPQTALQRAETEFAAGAPFLQIALDVGESARRSTGPGSSSGQVYESMAGPKWAIGVDVLGAIETIGWRLEHMNSVFVPTHETSRDKFLSSGQDVGVFGKVVAIYLFRRVGEWTPREPTAEEIAERGAEAEKYAELRDL